MMSKDVYNYHKMDKVSTEHMYIGEGKHKNRMCISNSILDSHVFPDNFWLKIGILLRGGGK